MHKCHLWIAALVAVAAMAVGLSQQPADTILYNGKVITVDRNFSITQAVAVSGKQIAAVGSDADVLKLAGPNTLKVDLKGKTVTPGLINTHVHLESIGGYAREAGPLKTREFPLNMRAVKTKEDLVKQIRDIIAAFRIKPGEWLFFPSNPRGDQAKLIFDEMNATELDKGAPNNPIVMQVGMPPRNINMVNGKAIEWLWRKYGDFIQTNGRYWIDASGKPTGVLETPASRIVWEDPEIALGPKAEDVAPYYKKILMEEYTSLGVTTISGALNTSTVQAYEWLDTRGEMPLRYGYGAMAAFGPLADLKKYKLGAGTDTVFITSVTSRAVDGAGARMCITLPRDAKAVGEMEGDSAQWLSSTAPWWPRGQCSLDIEYNGGTRGARIKKNYFLDWYQDVAQEGLRSANAHVSGNDAHTRLIAEWERIDKAKPGSVKGWAMDHCNLIDPKDIPRAAKLGLMWSCDLGNAIAANSAAAYGEQVLHTYPDAIKTMLDAGINVSSEGDWDGIEIAMTRKDSKGKVWGADQRVDRKTALRIATQNGANYALKGDKLGSIESGKLADLVILDRDYMTMPEDEIAEMRPLMTMLGGKIVFVRTDFSNEQNLKPAGAEISTHEELRKRRPTGGIGGGG